MRATLPIIVDQSGQPIRADAAFNAAERAGLELASWTPNLMSADAEWLGERNIALARVHDLIRNHGGISGAVQTQIDNMVGSGLRLAAKPNWMALGVDDPALQLKIESAIESAFDDWGNDPGYYCDVERNLTFGGLIARGCRTHLASFEILAVAEWLARPGSKFATAIRGVDPLRLSQPSTSIESSTFKSGIEFDQFGAATAYHIANRVPSDPYSYSRKNDLLRWVRVPRETSWGRTNVIHIFDHEKDGQTRGRGGILAALTRAKMLDKHEQAHLQQSILSAVYAMFITSPLGQDSIGQALGAGQGISADLANYLSAKTDFHKEANVKFNGVRIPHLFPGEKIEHSKPAHPSANFESFERIFHRYIAASLNMTYEQFTKDYSQTNYSGHRAALLDYWRFVNGRRSSISGKYAGAVYVLWLEEFLDSGGLADLLPKGAPQFWDAKAAWTRHEWIGPGQGQIDPLKEANATMVEFRCGVTTLEAECAARGKDWRSVLIQRAQEAAEAKRLEAQYGLEPGSLDYAKGASPAPPGPEEADPAAPAPKKEPEKAPTEEPASA